MFSLEEFLQDLEDMLRSSKNIALYITKVDGDPPAYGYQTPEIFCSQQKMKKWFSVKLQQAPLEPILEGFLASKGGYPCKVEGEWKEIEYQTYRIYLTDEQFPTVLAGNKFLQIEESTDNINYYPSTNPQILKFLI